MVPAMTPLGPTLLIATGVAVGCAFIAGAAVGCSFAAPTSGAGAEVGAAAEPQAKISDRTRNNVMWMIALGFLNIRKAMPIPPGKFMGLKSLGPPNTCIYPS